MPRPRLRPLESFVVEQDGQRLVGLRDPAGYTDQVAVFPLPLLDLVSLFDGERTVEGIRQVLTGRWGEAPSAGQIQAIIERLDEAGFLDTPRFAARRRRIDQAFRRSPVRPAAHAGAAYAPEAAALAQQIEAFFMAPDGPGPITGGAPAAAAAPAGQPLRGLVAPHIDFHRGGPTYAWAYRDLQARADADLYVILGTCHAGMPDPFAVTLKPFQTPLGRAEVDRDFYEQLRRRARQDLLASEAAHRSEHSVEFQVVMLQHLLGARRPFTILPVLAAYLHEAVHARSDPEANPRVARFLDGLLETMAAAGRRVCLVAGVDLAHVGPRFGDPEPNTPESLAEVGRADRLMLEEVTAGNPLGFFGSLTFDADARRICGASPIYTFLRLLPGVPGRLLRYSQWPDPQGAVSFCAAAFP